MKSFFIDLFFYRGQKSGDIKNTICTRALKRFDRLPPNQTVLLTLINFCAWARLMFDHLNIEHFPNIYNLYASKIWFWICSSLRFITLKDVKERNFFQRSISLDFYTFSCSWTLFAFALWLRKKVRTGTDKIRVWVIWLVDKINLASSVYFTIRVVHKLRGSHFQCLPKSNKTEAPMLKFFFKMSHHYGCFPRQP